MPVLEELAEEERADGDRQAMLFFKKLVTLAALHHRRLVSFLGVCYDS